MITLTLICVLGWGFGAKAGSEIYGSRQVHFYQLRQRRTSNPDVGI
jgi:hypothetical protein